MAHGLTTEQVLNDGLIAANTPSTRAVQQDRALFLERGEIEVSLRRIDGVQDAAVRVARQRR